MSQPPANLIGVIGDMHLKDFLSYADNISDRRVEEKKKVLDFIVKSFEDCPHIVFIGDIFHRKNNTSETNRQLVEFVERFNDKEVYMISGNHCKKEAGKTGLDFLGEIKKKNWHIFTKPGSMPIAVEGGKPIKVDFLPYMINAELGVDNMSDATKKIVKQLDGGDILFAHHTISDTILAGISTNLLADQEVVLPKEVLEKKYKLVVAGHIHDPKEYGRTVITGSVFNEMVGDKEKYIWKIAKDLSVSKYRLPSREIHKLQDPTDEQLDEIKKDSIVKVIVTKKKTNISKLKEKLNKFDASLLIENYPNRRKKAHIKEGAFDFSIEALLELYAKEKDVDHKLLVKGLGLINE